jgi:serine/threonine protein kinase
MDSQTENTQYLNDLVEQNQHEILSAAENRASLTGISVGPQLNAHPLSHGRLLTIHYDVSGELREKVVYLKFRKNYFQRPDKYMTVFHQIPDAEQFLPKFYFSAKTPTPNETVIAMEFIRGISLRKLLYSKMFWGKTYTLKALFYQNGRKMRMFHDAQPPQGSKTIRELLDALKNRMETTPYFSVREKDGIRRQLEALEKKIDASLALPLIRNHHDWSLRNIIIEADQRLKLIDLDAFNRSLDWRWNDFVYFLINMESQIKYWPFLRRQQIADLWEHFYQGYFAAGRCEAVNPKLVNKLIYLVKLDFWTDAYSLADFYNIGLGKRYVKQLKKSLAVGRYTILADVGI